MPTASIDSAHLTSLGTALGTVSYMSPEQARGEDVDTRSDLFSFGAVLYEMATGRQAFEGSSTAVIFTAILTQAPPPPSELNPDLPAKLDEVIKKALEKDREVRYLQASELRADLKRLQREMGSGGLSAGVGTLTRGPSAGGRGEAESLRDLPFRAGRAGSAHASATGVIHESPRPKRPRLLAVMSVLALIVVAAGGTWLFLGRKSKPRSSLRIVPFSGLSGVEDYPSFSPDGKQIAYAWNGGSGSVLHIYVKLVGAGTPLQLTHDSLSDKDPAWSPDGRYIALFRYSQPFDGRGEVISIPALGGPERRLSEINVSDGATRDLTWSPDGKFVAIGNRPSPAEQAGVFLISSKNGEKHRLTSPPRGSWGDTDPAFSPDGQTLAFVRWSMHTVGDIYLQNTNATEARRLTFDDRNIQGIAWMPDGRNIVFSSWRSVVPTLWKAPVSGGEIEPLAGIGEDAKVPALSPAANLLAYRKLEKNVNIWGIQVTPAGGVEGPPRELISGSRQQHDDEFSPDGRRIVFSSDRSGEDEIWVADADGSNATQLTSFGGPVTGTPRWSPDGRWIAFDSRPDGQPGVFVVSAEGGTPRRLTRPTDDAFAPTWSTDGRWIYFCWNRSGDFNIWKMPGEGGPAVQVTKTGALEARESKDGKWLFFSRPTSWLVGSGSSRGIWKKPIEGDAEALVLDKATDRLWTLAGEYLYFVDVEAEPHATINRLDLATGKITRIAEAEKDPRLLNGRTGLSVSPGGEWIIYPQVDVRILRIMLVENLRW